MMFEQDYENPYNTYNPYNTFTSPLWYPTWHVLIKCSKIYNSKNVPTKNEAKSEDSFHF